MTPSRDNDDGLARLTASRAKDEPAFLGAHHLEAARRVEQLIRRAQLSPRVTMSYSPARLGGGGSSNGVETASQGAADARLKLSRLAALLPPDCWGVVFDVCALGKGLQVVETERRWPRRSAKLVLRIGLDQLATQFGLSAHAVGDERGRTKSWMDARLPLVSDS